MELLTKGSQIQKNSRRIFEVAIIVLALTTFWGKSSETLLRGIDSNLLANVALNLTSDGLLPKLPPLIKDFRAPVDSESLEKIRRRVGSQDVFNDHPFFFHWLNGLVMRTFGPSAWSARLLTAVSATLAVWMVYLLGSFWVNPIFGGIGAFLLIFCRDFILPSASVCLDPWMVFFILLSFWAWQKQKWFFTALSVGIGLWVKSPVVLLVYPVWLVTQPKQFKTILAAATTSILIGSGVWLLTGFFGGWDLVVDFWSRQFIGTAVSGRSLGANFGPLKIFHEVFTGFIPGLPFLIIGIAQIIIKKSWRKPEVKIPAVALGVFSIAMGLNRYNVGSYYAPIFPFLAILSVQSVWPWIESKTENFHDTLFSLGTGLILICLGALVCLPISLGPESFVALKKVMPFIQADGTPFDTIMLIEGDEPVGGVLDEKVLLGFYTQREVVSTTCDGAQTTLERTQPKWIFGNSKTLARCLGKESLLEFNTQYRVGTQDLRQRNAQKLSIDLSPLLLEALPTVDGIDPVLNQTYGVTLDESQRERRGVREQGVLGYKTDQHSILLYPPRTLHWNLNFSQEASTSDGPLSLCQKSKEILEFCPLKNDDFRLNTISANLVACDDFGKICKTIRLKGHP